jgi:dihydrofolate synthase/folylpolyglutamate synthase
LGTLDELTPWLFSRVSGGVSLGLERTEQLLAGAGNPHRLFRSILIGGTNGKGSVSALCEAALWKAGRRTGLYTSPHLVSFTERIRIDGVPIREEVLAEIAERLRPAIEETGASFFEATTAMAFIAFAEAGVEIAVVEVGLGGRLDSTNVLTPLVTAVTNVAVDHTEFLGDTVERIALEKAGIFKPGVPVVTAERETAPLKVLRERAAEVGAPFHTLDAPAGASAGDPERAPVEPGKMLSTPDGLTLGLLSSVWGERLLQVPLRGPYQARNVAQAVAVLGLLPEAFRPEWKAVEAGFRSVRWPGRLQVEHREGVVWVFDVAHNPAGSRVLVEALSSLKLPSPVVGVVGILSDKDWRLMLPILAGQFDHLILTTPDTAPPGRRWDLDAVSATWLSELAQTASRTPEVELHADLSDALRRAGEIAEGGSVVVTGSVHTVGDTLAHLGISPV